MCRILTCSAVDDEIECLTYKTQEYNFVCDWLQFTSTQGYCFNDCPAKYIVVFTIDTSTSVIDPNQGGDEMNRYRQLNTTLETMRFIWSISTFQNDIPYENTKFALITYNAIANIKVWFDLNNNFTTLEEYVSRTRQVFADMEYLDDTATAPAISRSYDVFVDGAANGIGDADEWRKFEIVITDGRPNVPATSASPCTLNGEYYNFNELFFNETVKFYAILVGFSDSESFSCLEEPRLLSKTFEVETFVALGDEIRQVFTSEVCQLFPTSAPTNLPSIDPTPYPTPSPTSNPTPNPTSSPTGSPTERPTPRPTNTPTERPTERPTDRPTPQPTDHPTDRPTDRPTPEPTNPPTLRPTDTEPPTQSPTKRPTDYPTGIVLCLTFYNYG